MKKKQKKKNLSRDHILESALKVIGFQGMGNLTHRSVAAKANVAHSTVSYYFRTIDDIASAAFKKIVALFSQGMLAHFFLASNAESMALVT